MNDRDCENCKHHTEKGCDSWDCEFERRMTREDAIKRLKLWLICSEEYTENDVSMNDAIRVAINSLEIDERYELEYEQAEEIHREKEQAYMQGYEDACKKYRKEPCEDAISRQAVQDYIAKYLSQFLYDDVRQAIEVIDEYIGELPSVNPQEPSRKFEDYEKEIEDLQNQLDIAEHDKERLREEVTKWNLKATIKA